MRINGCFTRTNRRRKFFAGGGAALSILASPALAQIPAGPTCTVDRPPPDAGLYATPGGFLMVHPRNAALSDGYTGCKTL